MNLKLIEELRNIINKNSIINNMTTRSRNHSSLLPINYSTDALSQKSNHQKTLTGISESMPTSTRVSITKNLSRKRPSIFYIKQNRKEGRHDRYGNEIVKGSKNHKVAFIDNVTSYKLTEIIFIETTNKTNDKVNCECSINCIVF